MSNKNKLRFDTAAIHAGKSHNDKGAHLTPIYQTSTFTFENMAAVDRFVAGEGESYIYTRGGHPGRAALAKQIAALEGYELIAAAKERGDEGDVVSAEIFSSGMAAISASLLGCAKAGDHVIAQVALYGSTDHLISELLPSWGITTSRVKRLEAKALTAELEKYPNTTAVYLESPANPTMALIDIAEVVQIAHAHGARVIVDNTFATPVLQRPLAMGVDVVLHSTTKYINGHGTVIGGAVVSRDLPLMEEKIRPLIAYLGGVPSPFDCWLTSIGLKTMPLRMRQHCSNAMQVARYLETHPNVEAVYYPGLESNPQFELAQRQMDDFGAMLAFEVKGGVTGGRTLLDNVELISLAVSLGNVDTLIEHPATMTHQNVPVEDRAEAGITDGLIRLSVGLEAAEDIIADLDRALNEV